MYPNLQIYWSNFAKNFFVQALIGCIFLNIEVVTEKVTDSKSA